MADFTKPRREGVTLSSDLPPVLHILLKKNLPKNNIVVGIDAPQLRFIQRHLGVKAREVERVTDDMLAGYDGLLFHVSLAHRIDLSPELRARTGIWAAEPITKGSAAINALVKFAWATLLRENEKELKRDVIDRVGDALVKEKIVCIYALMWKAAWILSAPVKPFVKWKDPWEHELEWINESMNIGQRLNVLYNKLVGYVYFTMNGSEAATKFGIKPSKQQYYKTINLDPTRVYRTITALSKWKQGRMNPYICALEISTIWS